MGYGIEKYNIFPIISLWEKFWRSRSSDSEANSPIRPNYT